LATGLGTAKAGSWKPSAHQAALLHFCSQLYLECAQKVPAFARSSQGAQASEPQSAWEDQRQQLPLSSAFHGPSHQTALLQLRSQLNRLTSQKLPLPAGSSQGAHSSEPQSACEDHLISSQSINQSIRINTTRRRHSSGTDAGSLTGSSVLRRSSCPPWAPGSSGRLLASCPGRRRTRQRRCTFSRSCTWSGRKKTPQAPHRRTERTRSSPSRHAKTTYLYQVSHVGAFLSASEKENDSESVGRRG
jgi:hypothetical protein